MTPQQIVGLAARLFAIWMAVAALQFVIQIVNMEQVFPQRAGQGGVWISYVTAAVWYGVALLLWFFPMVVGHRLVPRTRFQDTLRLPAQQVIVVACVVLGLAVIALQALPTVAYYLALVVFWVGQNEEIRGMFREQPSGHFFVNLMGGLIQLAVGLFMVFRAHALAAWIMPSPCAAGEEKAGTDDQ